MRTFNYDQLTNIKWDSEILSLVAKIHEYKGKQDLYIRQKPIELNRLTEIAKIQSVESSNKIEGIITTAARIKQLVQEKTTPRNRDENEIAGYRDVLNAIHESHEFIPVKPNYILQLHRDMLTKAGFTMCGQFKNVSNYIQETLDDGNTIVRFKPLEPSETPFAIETICESYNRIIASEKVDSLLIIPVFILDFLCIHPFNDGNGRMSRLLTLLLLYQNGYHVGKYISIEKEIEKNKDLYYDALQASDIDWQKGKNDPTPFIRYMLKIILACYVEFENRVQYVGSETKSTAYDIVKAFVSNKIGKFVASEVISSCPSVGRTAILNAIKKLVEEGIIIRQGNAKNTYYIKNPNF